MNPEARGAERTPFPGSADRFPLGNRNGIITPAAEPISDTAATPFGLTLRVVPERRDTVQVREWGTGATVATEKVTEMATDGNGADVDTRFDVATDV